MRIIVPFAAETPKTRLSGVLEDTERRAFARAMLEDVLSTLREAGTDPEVLATAAVDVNVPTIVDERPLTDAVNAVLTASEEAVAVVMADLALATPASIDRLLNPDGGVDEPADADAGTDVTIAPGRGGGTNALVVRHPAFRVDYHGVSYRDHLQAARSVGAAVRTVDSHRLATDVDEPADLAEVLLHGDGEARVWLVERGFELAIEGGRVGVERRP
ncbi:MAG: 2-phospho-L-lactate guanylyltransferase [Halobacteriales archaeon]